MIIHTMEQRSPEWHAIRKGKFTASDAQAIGNNGKGLESLVWEIVTSLYSSSTEEGYTNGDIERGKEYEKLAVEMYEWETGGKTKPVGFVELDEFRGCSPDRFVNHGVDENGAYKIHGEGLLEIKCPKDSVYFKILLGGEKPDTKHVWQAQMQMLICERKWCDLLYFNPNFQKSLAIFRIHADPVQQEKIKLGLEKGKQLMQSIKEKYQLITNS